MLTRKQQDTQCQTTCDIPGRAGLPGGWKESMTSQSHSTRAALVLVPGPSGPSAWVGQMRCRSSRINKEGKQSRASCTCIHTHRCAWLLCGQPSSQCLQAAHDSHICTYTFCCRTCEQKTDRLHTSIQSERLLCHSRACIQQLQHRVNMAVATRQCPAAVCSAYPTEVEQTRPQQQHKLKSLCRLDDHV